jgi:hypothetical protein
MVRSVDTDGFTVLDKKAVARERLFRRVELRDIGRRLMRSIELVKEYPRSHTKKHTNSDNAQKEMIDFCNIIEELLRNKCNNQPFGREAISAVWRALNTPIPQGDLREYCEGDPPVQYLYLNRPWRRGIAEYLVKFLQCYIQDHDLERHNPIGTCRSCGVLFFKQRIRKEYCSSKCRSRVFNIKIGREYFRERAKENRKGKKNMKAAKKEAAKKKAAKKKTAAGNRRSHTH